MRLSQILPLLCRDTTIWISEDPSVSEGLYFGPAGEAAAFLKKDYNVKEIYPEYYPSIYNFAGITILVTEA